MLATGGTLSALGAYIFVYLIWRTIDGPASLRAGARRAQQVVQQSRGGALPALGARPPAGDAAASATR